MERQISAVDHTSRITAMQDRIVCQQPYTWRYISLECSQFSFAHAARSAFDGLGSPRSRS